MTIPIHARTSRGTMRAAIYLQDAHAIRDGMDFARYAEERGFEAVWQAESRLVREATVPMAAFASVTSTIKVGSGVVDCWSRNPARLAATFSTLDDLAPGRVILGLGAWWDPLAAKVGIPEALILRFANMVDLYRVKGIGSEYAELLEASGVDTVPELAHRVPANLAKKLAEVNAERKLVRQLPTEAEVARWVETAKTLPRFLEH